MAQFPPDGLVGMAFEQISAFAANPFFQTAISQGEVTESVFGFTLSEGGGGGLFLGGTDTSAYSGPLTSVPVTTVVCAPPTPSLLFLIDPPLLKGLLGNQF